MESAPMFWCENGERREIRRLPTTLLRVDNVRGGFTLLRNPRTVTRMKRSRFDVGWREHRATVFPLGRWRGTAGVDADRAL